jgi:excisionase family DNA binding protein
MTLMFEGDLSMLALMDVKTAAKHLGISRWTVMALVRKGQLVPVRIGRRLLLEESELERFINESRQN